MARTKKKGERMTQISISLPDELVKQIDQLAQMDNRNRSNYIANEMAKLAKRQQ
jgi:ribbon-helix-helix protein, copG family